MECTIIAGPNGAGKTTFANEFLPHEGRCLNFINADLIASGLSPFAPERVALAAGRIMIRRIEYSIEHNESFAFESTLSGKVYAHKIKEWKDLGYRVVIYYFKLPNVEMAVERVKQRVAQGGHHVPEDVIRRRFDRSWTNFELLYRSLADRWIILDTTQFPPIVLAGSENK